MGRLQRSDLVDVEFEQSLTTYKRTWLYYNDHTSELTTPALYLSLFVALWWRNKSV